MISKEKRMDKKFKHFNPMALREKYSIGSKKQDSPFSSFWSDNDWNTRRTEFIDVDEDAPKKRSVDHIQLAQYRRAISNFVNIVTGRSDIPVKFQSRDSSYTDGKTVVIGSKIDEKSFDPVVGLALHEGSHIKLSDFNFLKNLENNIPEEMFLDGEKVGFGRYDVIGHVKNLLNYVEDRRIDWYVYSSSPGYKGYYQSMYNKYFHSKIIDKGIKSNEYTDLDWDSYIFRILNLTNKNRRLDVLPGLNEIYNLIFKGGKVKTLTSTEDAFNVALDVYRVILGNVVPLPEVGDENKMMNDDLDAQMAEALNELDTQNYHRERNGLEPLSAEEAGIPMPSDVDYEPESFDPSGNPPSSDVELTDAQKKQLSNGFTKQKNFVDGNPQKTGTLTKKDSQMVQTMEDAGVDKVQAGTSVQTRGHYDYNVGEYTYTNNGIEVIYVKKLTQSMIDNSLFPYLLRRPYGEENLPEWMTQGLSLGTKLGRKLQVRGESRDLKWNRLDAGRIDKRLIAELGFGNSRVFSQTFTESYSDAFLHISVDASGSMSGEKWKNTMSSVVAICKAVDMISNVDIQVSFRSTHSSNNRGYGADNPLVLVAYDSRVDKFQKVKKMFPFIYPGGTTPEGLCFEALLKDIVPSTNDRDSYFLNLSDGMPMFSNSNFNYYNAEALNHTKSQVNEFRKMGIKVLSYFVGDGYRSEDNMRDFKTMYGKDAEFINLNNVTQISKTMNTKFLEKN
tara:strand:- start:3738 stop:5924 length:2187 start_codon:yes stop_codon:yes gene_type:complete